MSSPSRRELLVWLPTAFALLRCGKPPQMMPPAKLRFLTDTEAATLKSVADFVFPPDGSKLGAVSYVDALLSAFDDAEPKVLLGSLTEVVPLDRVSEAAWRLRLFGSDGVTGGGPNDAVIGKHIGLRQQTRDALAKAAMTTFDKLDPDTRELLCDLVTQASFSAPVYGGNVDGAGWALIGSQGAVMPKGYTQWDATQMKNVELAATPDSTPEPGTDPHPLDQFTRELMVDVANATGGKVA